MPYEKKEFYVFDYWRDFDELVQEHLNLPDYDFSIEEEGRNDSVHAFFDITGQAKHREDALARVLAGDFEYNKNPYILLEALVHKEVLPPGNYLIIVSW